VSDYRFGSPLLLVATALLLSCASAPPAPREAGTFDESFAKLAWAETEFRLPNSHCKTAEQRDADIRDARQRIMLETVSLAAGVDNASCDELLEMVRRFHPDDMPEPVCAAVRLLVAAGVPFERIRTALAPESADYASLFATCAADGQWIRAGARDPQLIGCAHALAPPPKPSVR